MVLGEAAAQPTGRSSSSEFGKLRPELRLLSMEEVATVLRTTRKAVYQMLARGQLPPTVRIGRRVLLREQDLLHWLEERRAKSPKENRR